MCDNWFGVFQFVQADESSRVDNSGCDIQWSALDKGGAPRPPHTEYGKGSDLEILGEMIEKFSNFNFATDHFGNLESQLRDIFYVFDSENSSG